ncbi:unnamed protein product, partial [Brassica rapa]
KAGRCSFVVEARLLRFWEAKNVKRGGELMWMDLLMVDVNPFPLLPEICVQKAEAGWAHYVAVTESHEVYTWGWKECIPTGRVFGQVEGYSCEMNISFSAEQDSVETTSENFGDDEHISRGGEMQRRFRDPGSSTILLDYRLYTMVKTKGFSLDLCGCKSLFVQSANTTHMFEPNTNLAAVFTSLSDSDLTFEMNAPSQRTRVGRAVKPTQKLDHG